MATSTPQRIGIWIIAVVMVIGTIASFAVIVLGNENTRKDSEEQQKMYDDYVKQMKEQQEKNAAASKPLEGYSAEAFDPATITELKVDTLVEGQGKTAEASSTVKANYFGWTSDGKIFDSTNKEGTVTPIDFSLTGVIEGWTKGLTGVKEGSTVKLWIPEDMAYGPNAASQGQPAGPLVFVVELKEVK